MTRPEQSNPDGEAPPHRYGTPTIRRAIATARSPSTCVRAACLRGNGISFLGAAATFPAATRAVASTQASASQSLRVMRMKEDSLVRGDARCVLGGRRARFLPGGNASSSAQIVLRRPPPNGSDGAPAERGLQLPPPGQAEAC